MYWKIRPLKQFAPRGPRDCRGVQIAEGSVFSNPSQLEAVYCHSFLQSRGVLEINLQIILAVYKFNTLPLYKKECLFTIFLSYPTATDILLNNFKSIYLFVTLEYWVISSQYYDYYVDTLTNITITDSFGRGSQKKSTTFRILAIYFLRQSIVWSQISYPNHITSFFYNRDVELNHVIWKIYIFCLFTLLWGLFAVDHVDQKDS